MDDSDVVSYLRSKGLEGRRATGAELTYPCFFQCNESAHSHKRKLYINTLSGLFDCKVCLTAGNFYSLQKHFGDAADNRPPAVSRADMLEAAAHLAHQMLLNNDEAILYLMGKDRGLSKETIEAHRIGFVPSSWSLSGSLSGYSRQEMTEVGLISSSGRDFFSDSFVIPYQRNNKVIQLRAKDVGGKYRTMTGDQTRIFNGDRASAREVLIVEGEFDAMAVEQLFANAPARWRGIGVLAIPGATNWPHETEDLISNASRVFIGLDPDEAGRRASKRIKDRMGQRAREIEWPAGVVERALGDGFELKQLDWSSWIAFYGPTWESAADMLRHASGRKLLSIADAASRWLNRRKTGGIKTGFRELDSWIEPGLLPGQVMVVLAKTGAGKSQLLANLAYKLRTRGVLFVTLEMTAAETFERLARIYRFYFPNATISDITKSLSKIMVCEENRLTADDLESLIEEYVDEQGVRPDVLFVDYLGYYARSFRGTEYERTSDAVMQLKAEAKRHNIAVVAPHQVNRGADAGQPLDVDDARGSGVVEETADFLLGLFRPDDGSGSKDGITRLSLLKSRHGHAGKTTTLQSSPFSLVFIDKDDSLASRAANEFVLYERGLTYDQFITEQQQFPY